MKNPNSRSGADKTNTDKGDKKKDNMKPRNKNKAHLLLNANGETYI